MNYYDPMFYISSEKMPFNIRIEVKLRQEQVDVEALNYAVAQAIKRYPYFAIQVVRQTTSAGAPTEQQATSTERQATQNQATSTEQQSAPTEELIAVPNERPIVVYPGPEVYPLGGEEVNYHMTALSYYKNEIYFYITHVITDGSGFFPFIKTVLYYYLCKSEGVELDPKGIQLAGDPFYDDELGNPFPEEKMAKAVPLGKDKDNEYFRLIDGGFVNDEKGTVYHFRLNTKEILDFSFDNDGSPCALLSSLMTKAIWSLHPQEEKDIVSAISFNLKPGLGNKHNHRLLCSALRLNYPSKVKDWEILRLCTITRSMVSLKSAPANVLVYSQKRKESMERLMQIPTVEEKKQVLGKVALDDAVSNTFSVSYVGQMGLGSLEPYIESIYNITDGSTYQTLFIEVSAVNEHFNIAMIQGFSSDAYYRAFLNQLTLHGLHYIEEEVTDMNVPGMILP